MDIVPMIEAYKQVNNFDRENGMELELIEPGHIRYSMVVLEKHLSSPNTCHGGLISGFMDSIIGASALSMAFTEKKLVSTVEFKINMFKPAFLGDRLIGEGKIEYKGKSLISSSGAIYCENRDNLLIAKALGTFNLYPIEKREIEGLMG
jgi:acyl-CoA thioesterase